MTGVRSDNNESAHESGRVSSGIQAKWRHYDTVAATAPLHQEVAIPFVGHSQRERDAKLFSVDSGAPVHHTFDPAIARQRCAVPRSPGIRLRGPGTNRCGSCDFNVLGFEVCQARAGSWLLCPRIASQHKGPNHSSQELRMHIASFSQPIAKAPRERRNSVTAKPCTLHAHVLIEICMAVRD